MVGGNGGEALVEALVEGFGGGIWWRDFNGGGIWWREMVEELVEALEGYGGGIWWREGFGNWWRRWWRDLAEGHAESQSGTHGSSPKVKTSGDPEFRLYEPLESRDLRLCLGFRELNHWAQVSAPPET
jgi:hypothetical protein